MFLMSEVPLYGEHGVGRCVGEEREREIANRLRALGGTCPHTVSSVEGCGQEQGEIDGQSIASLLTTCGGCRGQGLGVGVWELG